MIRLVAALIGVVVAALSFVFSPEPHRLGTDRTGSTDLADRVADAVGDDTAGYRGLSVAFVEGGRIETALVGDPAGKPVFETGSVAKVFTGMLFAELVRDGTVQADDRVRTALPELAGTAAGDVTLAELASHRSGLPRLAPRSALRSVWANLSGGNPYGQDGRAVVEAARTVKVGTGRGEVHYSNFGMALLGQALAARAGTPYPELATARILRPLGMTGTSLDADPSGLAQGSTAAGRPVDAWSGAGYAPAGIGTRSTAADLGKLVAAMLDGSAPGADAATPRFPAGDDARIGYAWFTDRYDGRQVTWHNGGTGGFRTYVGFDTDARRGVVVLGNTDRDVDAIGLRLLGVDASNKRPLNRAAIFVTIGLVGYLLASLPSLALTRTGSRWRPAPDRLRAIGGVVSAVAVALLLYRFGAWLTLPPLLWSLTVGVAAAAAALLAFRARVVPLMAGGSPPVRWTTFAIELLVDTLAIATVLAIW